MVWVVSKGVRYEDGRMVLLWLEEACGSVCFVPTQQHWRNMHGLEELGFWLLDARVPLVITMGGFRFCSNLTCVSVSSLRYSHQHAAHIVLLKNMAWGRTGEMPIVPDIRHLLAEQEL